MEYNRLKAEREAAFEAEAEKARIAKEVEIQRLRSQQERAQDHQVNFKSPTFSKDLSGRA